MTLQVKISKDRLSVFQHESATAPTGHRGILHCRPGEESNSTMAAEKRSQTFRFIFVKLSDFNLSTFSSKSVMLYIRILLFYTDQKDKSEANGGEVKDIKMEEGNTSEPTAKEDKGTKKRPAEEDEDLK